MLGRILQKLLQASRLLLPLGLLEDPDVGGKKLPHILYPPQVQGLHRHLGPLGQAALHGLLGEAHLRPVAEVDPPPSHARADPGPGVPQDQGPPPGHVLKGKPLGLGPGRQVAELVPQGPFRLPAQDDIRPGKPDAEAAIRHPLHDEEAPYGPVGEALAHGAIHIGPIGVPALEDGHGAPKGALGHPVLGPSFHHHLHALEVKGRQAIPGHASRIKAELHLGVKALAVKPPSCDLPCQVGPQGAVGGVHRALLEDQLAASLPISPHHHLGDGAGELVQGLPQHMGRGVLKPLGLLHGQEEVGKVQLLQVVPLVEEVHPAPQLPKGAGPQGGHQLTQGLPLGLKETGEVLHRPVQVLGHEAL